MSKQTNIISSPKCLRKISESLNIALSSIILLTLFLSFENHISAQNSPHPSFRQFTTDNGLPSSEVYHILQDKKGYIWIATDNGVSRFDGYEFHNYGVKEGLVENVIFMMQLDSLDRVWMQAMNGRLYYFDEDTIQAYWNNKVIDTFINRSNSKGFVVEGMGEMVHYATYTQGIVSISNHGSFTFESHSEPVFKEVFERDGITISSITRQGSKEEIANYLESLDAKKLSVPIYLSTAQGQWDLTNLPFTDNKNDINFEAFFLGHGQHLIQSSNEVYFIENGKLIWQYYFPNAIRHACLMKNGQLFLGLGYEKGLRVYNSIDAFRKKEGASWISGETVSYFTEGTDGVKWFTTNENGIFYVLSDEISVYDKGAGLPDIKVTALTIRNENQLYMGLNNGEIWQLNKEVGSLNKMPEIPFLPSFVRDLHFDQVSQKLWAGKGHLLYFEDDKWKTNYLTSSKKYPFPGVRITPSPDNQRLWFAHHTGFGNLNITENIPTNIYENTRTYIVLEDYERRIWVGQSNGLFEWKDNALHACDSLNKLFSLRVQDIALMSDSTLVIATKGGGLVLWKDEKFENISTREGLTADMLECIYTDKKGNIWAGTLNGLNQISGTYGNRKVQQITVFHGLPSNEINRISTIGDQVWIATNKGLATFIDNKTNNISPKPILAFIMAHKDTLELTKNISLPFRKNNLSIRYIALNYKMQGKIPYRFRMDNGAWTETRNRSVNFPSLSFGERVFEVQAQNEDGIWSDSTILNFIIQPPWWRTKWATVGFLLTSFFLVFSVYKFRTQQLKRENKIQLQIAELERSALQAQMNPHFIFNCLNSIQNFILQNEKEAAITYLGSFASLVRSILNASVSGKIPLNEEIKLLNNYLDLEKLRFKNRFDFEIKIQQGIELFDVRIPPLLIQPYVENALIHGMAGKTSGGKVDILFEGGKSFLEVTISDNGKGMPTLSELEKNIKSQRSFGMAITKNRLKLLSDKKEVNQVITHTLYDENHQVMGTRVIIKIGIDVED